MNKRDLKAIKRSICTLLGSILILVSLSGCSGQKQADNAGAAVSPAEEPAVTEEAPKQEETVEKQETESSGELSDTELKELEKDMNSDKYNGFMVQEFSGPERIFWDEVFYLGADIRIPDSDTKKLEEEFLKETGDKELYLDVTFVDRKKAEEFAEETTGISYSEMKHPISFLYLKNPDVYANAHGDTNHIPIKFLKGSTENGIITARYFYESLYDANEKPTEYELKLEKTENGYRFISNLWEPEEGRDEAVRKIYDEIINKYANGISEGWETEKFEESNMNYLAGYLKDRASLGDDRDPMDIAGYYLEDIDGDGIDELFIGENEKPGEEFTNSIYEVLSIKSGDWTRVLFGGERDRYFYAKEGTFYNEGSSSAFNSVLIHYRPEGPYKFLTPIDGVIYDSENTQPDGGCWYYSENDFWNTENAKPISEKEYDDYYKKARESYVKIDYIPFSTLGIKKADSGKADSEKADSEKAEDSAAKGSDGYTDDQLIEMALNYYEKKNAYRPGFAVIDSRDGDKVLIWLYDDMGDHASTCAYYEIDVKTGKGSDTVFGDEVDLTK